MARSLLRRRGHLAFCHYERSEVIQKQVLLAMGLLPPCHKCGSWQAHIQASQKHLVGVRNDKGLAASVELVSRLPRRVFYTARNDKKLAASVQTTCHRERSVNCHGEESFKTTRPSYFLSLRAQRSNPKTSAVCNGIVSTMPQVWFVPGSHLGFAMTRACGQYRTGKQVAAPCILHGTQ